MASSDQVAAHQREHRPGRGAAEEGRRQEGQHRQPPGAGHERGQHHGEQPGLALLDDARAQDGRHVAAEAQQQRHARLAVQAHPVHVAVHDVGGAGHVAHVLEQAQAGEEDHQDGYEREDRAGAAPPRRRRPRRRATPAPSPSRPCSQVGEVPGDEAAERPGSRAGHRVGDPEQEPQRGQEHQQPPEGVRGHPVDAVGDAGHPAAGWTTAARTMRATQS